MSWQPEDDTRDEAEALEEEVISEELAARLLQDVCSEWLDGGEAVRVVVGAQSVTGVVVHAGEDFLTVRTHAGDLDVRFAAVTTMLAEADGRGRHGRRSRHPARFAGRLRELQASRALVVLAGPQLAVEKALILVVAADHLLADVRGSRLIVPLAAVDSVRHAALPQHD